MDSIRKSSGDCGMQKAKKQLVAYFKDPVPGTKIFVVEDRMDTLHVNTLIETGEYTGTVIHWRLEIPEDYPYKPAKGWVMDDFHFDERHHHHCYKDSGICTDYLSNFEYMNDTAGAYTGWTSSGTLTTLMIAMKQFFAEHDHHNPNSAEFQREANIVLQRSKEYKCKECDATACDTENSAKTEVIDEPPSDKPAGDEKFQRAVRELVCPVLARSPLEDSEMLIGFPVNVKCFDNSSEMRPITKFIENGMTHLKISSLEARRQIRIRKLRIADAELFPEFLSMDAYCTDLSFRGSEIENLNRLHLRSPLGHTYTHFVPIYLSKDHYQRSETLLKHAISVICFGVNGTEKSDFHPAMFVKVYPALMNKQIVSLLKCEAYDSEMLLTAFANLLRTYRYVCSRYSEVQEINDKHVVQFCNDEKYRTKEWTNDLGELLFKMAAVDRTQRPSCTLGDRETKKVYFEEAFARKIFWVDKYWKEHGTYDFFDQFKVAANKFIRAKDEAKIEAEIQCADLLNKFFEGSTVSLQLSLFYIECWKTFVTPDFDSLLDSNYGLLDKERIEVFRKSMDEIKKLSKLSQFFQRSGYPINNTEAAVRFIMKAYTDASRFGYFKA